MLQRKLLSGFFILTGILVIAGGISIYELRLVGSSVQELLDDNYQSIHACQKMLEALEIEENCLLYSEEDEDSELYTKLETSKSRFSSALKTAQSNITLQDESSYLALIKKLSDKLYQRGPGNMVTPAPITPPDYHAIHQNLRELRAAIKKLMEINQEAMYSTGKALKSRAYRASMPGVIAIIVSVIFTFVFSYLIHVFFVKPIKQTTKGVQNHLDYGTQFHTPEIAIGEIKDLTESIKKLIQK